MDRAAGAPLLELRGIVKRFGGKLALDGVDFDARRGEVHVICGENGAGKSTLMNILGGVLRPDEGEIRIDGAAVRFDDPLAAGRAGIGMVHQHFKLIASMTVAENLYLNRQPTRAGLFTNHRAIRDRAQALIERYSFDLDPDAPAGRLSVGQRQRTEILKALALDATLLILDEPTAVLTPSEVEELLGVIESLKTRGRTVLFITHKLREVMAVSDRVTVLRQGKRISCGATAMLSESAIALDMVGREMRPPVRLTSPAPGAPALAFEGVTMTDARGRRRLDGIDFSIGPGEILGVAGVDGNGQTELAEAAAGLVAIQAGAIRLGSKDVSLASVQARRRAGLGFIPEDRLDRGLGASMTIAENVSASNYRVAGLLSALGLIRMRLREAFAADKIRQFDVRGAAPGLPVGRLSGGNMQKIVIAREMERKPLALVVAQPSRGLDVGAMEFVHARILEAADRGAAILLISSELSEIFALSDRIAVMYRGRIVQILDRARASEEAIGLLMSGGRAAA